MTETYRYKAFISYSHADKAAADRLLKDLENYRVPRRLAGKPGQNGTLVPKRIGRIFRDRDELPAAEDLTAEVKKALTQSEFMIVLCSPAAAASRWVNREIIEFKKLTGERRILSVILSGEPFASNQGVPEQECFPPALRFKLGKNGQLTKTPSEPLAADLRPDGDGRRRGKLKLVAGLLEIGLDTLIERDLQRKMRRVMAVTAASVVAMLGMGLLTNIAVDAQRAAEKARNEAERLLDVAVTAQREAEQARNEAEGLIEYMSTGLKTKLSSVGRLDVMAEVSEKAIDYYDQQGDPEELSADRRERRGRILRDIGIILRNMNNDDESVGKQDIARAKLEEYYRTAKELWQEDPENPERIYAYSVGTHELASDDFEKGNLEEALPQLIAALDILQPIIGPNSNSNRYLQQAALLNSSLCATYINKKLPLDEAEAFCRDSLELGERLIMLEPQNSQLQYEYYFYVSWLGEWFSAVGKHAEAQAKTHEALKFSDQLVAKEPINKRWREQNIELGRRHAKILSRQGKSKEALVYLLTAKKTTQELVTADPSNKYWARLLADLITLIKEEQSNGQKSNGEI